MQVIKAVLLVGAATVGVPALAVFATPADIGPCHDPAPLEPSEHGTVESRPPHPALIAVRAQNRRTFSIAARIPECHHRYRHSHTSGGYGVQPPSVHLGEIPCRFDFEYRRDRTSRGIVLHPPRGHRPARVADQSRRGVFGAGDRVDADAGWWQRDGAFEHSVPVELAYPPVRSADFHEQEAPFDCRHAIHCPVLLWHKHTAMPVAVELQEPSEGYIAIGQDQQTIAVPCGAPSDLAIDGAHPLVNAKHLAPRVP